MASASIRFFMKDADAVKDADADQFKCTVIDSIARRNKRSFPETRKRAHVPMKKIRSHASIFGLG